MIRKNDLKHLGPALGMLRRASGQQQKKISEATGMSRSQVSRYERSRDMPNFVTVTRYLESIGADFADLQRALSAIKDGRPRANFVSGEALWNDGVLRSTVEAILKDALLEDGLLRPAVEAVLKDILPRAVAALLLDERDDGDCRCGRTEALQHPGADVALCYPESSDA